MADEFDFEKLRTLVREDLFEPLKDTCGKFGIDSALRIAHFLSQVSHESNDFKAVRENLNYSADALRKIFGKYFTDDETAAAYARQPERIANKIYASRMGNGDEASGEGWMFRGGGFIQLTGKSNYTEFSADMGDENILITPEIITQPQYAMASAGWFWNKHNVNAAADMGSDEAAVTAVTKKINGGTIGLPDRLARFNRIYEAVK